MTAVITRLIISDKGQTADNASVLADASRGVSIVKMRFLGTGILSSVRWHPRHSYLNRCAGFCQIQALRNEQKWRKLFDTLWIDSGLDSRGQEVTVEVMCGCVDLQS